jgi:alpha-beta hydrolase superfamily lysophospholipase
MASNGVCWPKDFLPNDIPQARILTYGYSSDYYSPLQQFLWQQGNALLDDLVEARSQPSEKRRAIVFVAHSLGGILVKRALIQSEMASIDERSPAGAVIRSTIAVVFFGTPHRGSLAESWPQILEKIASVTTLHNNRPEIPQFCFKNSSSNLLDLARTCRLQISTRQGKWTDLEER